jgi:hypothetical protein
LDLFVAIEGSDLHLRTLQGWQVLHFTFESAHFISSYFDKIIVIAYIRSAQSYITSAFQELIKHGVGSFELSIAAPNYNRFLMFANVFGLQNIIYKSYDSLINKESNTISDFWSTFDIVCSTDTSMIEENKSLLLEAVSLLYVYQKYSFRKSSEFYYQTQNKLIGALAGLGKSHFILGDNLIAPLIINDKEGIEFLEQRTNSSVAISHMSPDKNTIVIHDEDSFIESAVNSFENLKNLLSTYGISSESAVRSEIGVAKLVRQLDLKLNGNLLRSDFYAD